MSKLKTKSNSSHQGRETNEQIIMNIIFAAANGDIALLTRYYDQVIQFRNLYIDSV